MPTITVKESFGPPSPRTIRRKLLAFFGYLPKHCWPRVRSGGGLRRLAAAFVLLTLATFVSVRSQTVNARISVFSTAPARLSIDAQLPKPTTALGFRNSYAGILGLGERIEAIQGFGVAGEAVTIEKLASGEFRASQKVSRLRYEVNLAQPARPAQMSHVSWLNAEQGVLMLSDLLPERIDSGNFSAAAINVDVPNGWTVASNARVDGAQFSTDDPDTTAFLVGSALSERRERLGAMSLSLVTSGSWPISNSDLAQKSTEILQHYSRVTGFNLKRNVMLMLVPYAGATGPENWTAETRGNVVVLLMGNKGGRRKVLSRIGIVLSHEMFHLWVPNSLDLSGDYDWFFEGFTLYQALRTDLRLGFISFDDYLETIARVYDSYMSSEGRLVSLIEASERRWTTQASLVYDKGMLAAFVYDLSLRKRTDCKFSLDEVYAELFRVTSRGQANANETIIRVLTGRQGLESFARDYVEATTLLNLNPMLADYGLVLQPGSSRSGATTLRVGSDLNKSQRRFLGCLGQRK